MCDDTDTTTLCWQCPRPANGSPSAFAPQCSRCDMWEFLSPVILLGLVGMAILVATWLS